MPSSAGKKTEVLILSGFLGAGKTTLLKRILTSDSDLSGTVVIVNEFGDVGIDGLLLKGPDSDVVELAGGCICCALRRDLKLTLDRIQAEYNPRRILIEATGVADPAAIAEVFQDEAFRLTMEIRRVITVLEPDFWESRENFGTFFMSQLREADLILLNKIDDIGPEKIPQILKEIHEAIPRCRVVPTIHCNVDIEGIWEQRPSPILRTRQDPFHHAGGGLHASDAEKLGFEAFSYRSTGPVNEDCFREFIKGLPWELFRVKGLVRFHDRTVLLNYVGGRGEWAAWEGPQEVRLAFVGLGVNRKETIHRLEKCFSRP